jgi:hypothetical protein
MHRATKQTYRRKSPRLPRRMPSHKTLVDDHNKYNFFIQEKPQEIKLCTAFPYVYTVVLSLTHSYPPS